MTQDRNIGGHPQPTGTAGTGMTTGTYGHTERAVPIREERVGEPTTVRHEEIAVYRGESSRRDQPISVAVSDRQDGVRWGPVWAGLLTALTLFLLLELAFYAFGALDLDPAAGDSSGLVTGILALVSFFIGGLVAGATAIWKGLFSGLLHGFLVWALGVVAFIALTFFGASSLLGSFGDLTSKLGVGPQAIESTTDVSDAEAEEAEDTAKDAAGPAFLGLALPLGAAMLGGLIGSKIWPRKSDSDPETVQLRS